jgi:hypothetical protein
MNSNQAVDSVVQAPMIPWLLNHRQRAGRRRGAILVVVLVCLTVAGLIFVGLLRLAALEHQRIQRRQRAVQAEWLVESGLQRAAARLAADPVYTGETWALTAEEMGGQETATVMLRVEPIEGNHGTRRVQAEVQLGPPSESQVRRRKQITMQRSTGATP